MLYHPDVWLRLEALKLGCKLLEDADLNLQAAFCKYLGAGSQNIIPEVVSDQPWSCLCAALRFRFDSPQLNLQKAWGRRDAS